MMNTLFSQQIPRMKRAISPSQIEIDSSPGKSSLDLNCEAESTECRKGHPLFVTNTGLDESKSCYRCNSAVDGGFCYKCTSCKLFVCRGCYNAWIKS